MVRRDPQLAPHRSPLQRQNRGHQQPAPSAAPKRPRVHQPTQLRSPRHPRDIITPTGASNPSSHVSAKGHSICQSSMITRASSSESNCQPLSSSPGKRPLNDSIQAFCQGLPVSMNTESQSLKRYQSQPPDRPTLPSRDARPLTEGSVGRSCRFAIAAATARTRNASELCSWRDACGNTRSGHPRRRRRRSLSRRRPHQPVSNGDPAPPRLRPP